MKLGIASIVDPRLLPVAEATRSFYETRPAGRGPSCWEELSAVRAGVPTPTPAQPPAAEEVVTSGSREVPVRVHEPARGEPARGVVLDIHGGGFYMGSAARSDVRNQQLADTLHVAVVGIDYRLAPENPWPAAPQDCETAALWLVEHAQERFGTSRIAIVGFSAGATLAMTTVLRLRDRGIESIVAAVLQFGTYDLSARTPAGRLIADEYFLDAYAGHAPDRTLPDISPIYADPAGLPPVLVVVGENDVLLQDNMAMAARLSAALVDVDLRIYPGSPHGFTGHQTPMARTALDDIEGWLVRQFDELG